MVLEGRRAVWWRPPYDRAPASPFWPGGPGGPPGEPSLPGGPGSPTQVHSCSWSAASAALLLSLVWAGGCSCGGGGGGGAASCSRASSASTPPTLRSSARCRSVTKTQRQVQNKHSAVRKAVSCPRSRRWLLSRKISNFVQTPPPPPRQFRLHAAPAAAASGPHQGEEERCRGCRP